MASSITSEQAKALADGFFNDIGESKAGLTPKNSMAALLVVAGTLVDEVQKNLNNSDRVSSGALADSIKVLDPKVLNGKNIVVDIEALYYYRFINKGVKGTKRGAGGYSFKNDYVGKKFHNELRKWIIREGLRSRTDKATVNSRGVRSKKLLKTIRSQQDSTKALAYRIGRSIKMKGLKKTNFFDKAIAATETEAENLLAKGFKIDVINSLPNKL